MMKKLKIIVIISMVFIFSCDDIEEPFIDEMKTECGDASLPTPIKQILIEEFTGHKCGYCPDGDKSIELLKELYCDHLIPVSIHTGGFAEINSSGKYTYDYRAEDGLTISNYYEPTGFPSALINRKEYDEGLMLDNTYWLTIVSELLEQKPVADIHINSNYSSSERELKVEVDIVFFKSIDERLMLSVYFIEDSIVSWQKDYSLESENQDVEFYPHNHVFRDGINGAWGEEILNGQVNSNDVKSKTYIYTVNSEWNVENSSLIAFVYQSETKEVLQAAQSSIIN